MNSFLAGTIFGRILPFASESVRTATLKLFWYLLLLKEKSFFFFKYTFQSRILKIEVYREIFLKEMYQKRKKNL